jgi:hypothetical protein
MKRTATILGVAAVLFVSASAGAQGTFEGMIAYKFSNTEGVMRTYQKGTMMRQEMEMQGHGMSTIYDGAKQEAVMLMPDQKKFMKVNVKAMKEGKGMAGMGRGQPGPPDYTKMKVTPTGKSETIAGIDCEHYLFESTEEGKSSKIDICGATGMGFSGVNDQSGMMSTYALMKVQNPELAKLAKSGFFPLKMTFTEKGKTMSMEATKVEKKSLDAALFEIPAGYSELKIPGFPGGS